MATRLTDGKRTIEITIRTWEGTGYSDDWSNDFFVVGALPYDAEKDAYIVKDVEYCIDMANDTGVEGARCKYNEDGELVPDENVEVTVEELDIIEHEVKCAPRDVKRSKYRVIENDYQATERFYGNADADYIEDCQEYGIPQEDLDFLIQEWGDVVYDLLEEI